MADTEVPSDQSGLKNQNLEHRSVGSTGSLAEPESGPEPAVKKVHIATFRGIPQKLHRQLKTVAEDLSVSPGELAR